MNCRVEGCHEQITHLGIWNVPGRYEKCLVWYCKFHYESKINFIYPKSVIKLKEKV